MHHLHALTNRGRVTAVATAVALTFALAGCGSDTNDAEARAGGDPDALAADLESYYSGTDRALPDKGPQAQPGKDVWVLSCSSAAPGCADPASAAMDAGEAMGWDMTIADGKLDPNTLNNQVRAAIAAEADGLITVVVDCPTIAGPLKEAVDSGMQVMSAYGFDCDNEYTKGEGLFSAELSFGPQDNYPALIRDVYSRAIAGYIAESSDKPEIIAFRQDDLLVSRTIADGFDEHIRACPDCTVHTVTFTSQDLLSGSALQQKASAALSRHPNATAVMAPYDATILLGIGGAVEQARAAGRDLILTGGEGLAPNLDLIAQGKQQFAVGLPAEWTGWAMVDALNRQFAGEPQVDEGIGVKIVDGRQPPECRPFVRGECIDFKQHYKAMWGVS